MVWSGSATSPVACKALSENVSVGSPPSKSGNPPSGPTVAASTWKALSPLPGPMHIAPAAFLGAIVRTACAGHTVSMASSNATGALGSGLAHYIHPVSAGLTIDPAFLELKDFVGTAFSGTLGAAMAYLRMRHDGYIWSAHYEDSVTPPLSSNVAQPDFVFTDGAKLAIVEAKGTGKALADADDAAKRGYIHQIDTARNRLLNGGSAPTEGYSFGTALNVSAGAGLPIEMACVHQQFPTLPVAGGGGGAGGAIGRMGPQNPGIGQTVNAVKQLNYHAAMVQMGIGLQDIDRIVPASGRPDKLHFGPELLAFRLGPDIYTAVVAMPHGLLRKIRQGDLPGPVERPSSADPIVNRGRTPGYTFVNFADGVRVVLRERGAPDWSEADEGGRND
ncbi:hypothetical protein ACAN107058_23260 [Paracidovorax anthurii]|uniref:Uncharacterized protein n=2 Tax=Paracidovorax anthurii TaxID=78229 RepID=A0A328ZLA5_9BURK|nr:hypothetical protein AX018_1002136 [Paracidovorax anthurii]